MAKEKFIDAICKSYAGNIPSIYLGAGCYNDEIIPEAKVYLPFHMMNRHGLITGATGSGKTRTLQLMAEQLSAAGVPVFMPDIKGDLSGLAKESVVNDKVKDRIASLKIQHTPAGFPVELYSLSGKSGAQMRATVAEFGPVLISKILTLNDTQTGVLNILFKYADDKNLPIVDFNDLKKVLNFITDGPGADELRGEYGKISPATASTILRKIVSLEQLGINHIFGEPSFDIEDLFQKIDDRGVISLLNVSDIQQPSLFSTFMLALLVEMYQQLPEAGDVDKPKLVFFFDEAHYLFKDAPKAFMEHIEQIMRLIRSKGVGIFFCTQETHDVPPAVLAQLGNRIHHVIRAFTPNDRKALKETIKTFPSSDFYDMEQQFMQLGIGQAFITVLNEKGIPTETVVTHLAPPASFMGPLTKTEYDAILEQSDLYRKYHEPMDLESAFEILQARIQKEEAYAEDAEDKSSKQSAPRRQEKSTFDQVMSSPVAKQVGKEIVRGLFGMLFGSAPRKRSRKRGGLF